MNNLLLTTIFENGFQEIYLPAVDNKSHPIEIRPSVSGLAEDIVLLLEVWSGVWTLTHSEQFAISINEVEVYDTVLNPGNLINCNVKGTDVVFSLTVDSSDVGNTSFDKYFLDLNSVGSVGIGSNINQNTILYYNN